MRNYLISREIKSVSGNQVWKVKAKNKEEALEKFENGEGDFYDQNIEVESLGTTTIEEE